MDKKVVTRVAPSPTGYAHAGFIRTALYNYLFAKKHGGDFLVRIEDTDSTRFFHDAEAYIKETLEWFGLHPDNSPWNLKSENCPMRQSERDYESHIQKLLDEGHAYYAFDTPEYIDNAKERHGWVDEKGQQHTNFIYNSKYRMEMRNSLTMNVNEVRAMLDGPYVIRFKTPESKEVLVKDLIRGEVKFNTDLMDDKILVKQDGTPTYHLANTCDDHDMEVTHVIRGEEWLPSAPLHVLIYQAMGWDLPQFAHLPLILNPNGKGKLSKRSAYNLGIPVFPFDAVFWDKGKMFECDGFQKLGYLPEALLNFLVLLGWTPKEGKEILTMEEMISQFRIEDVHHGGAKFDIEKAKWFNNKYLLDVLPQDKLMEFVDFDGYYSDDKKRRIIDEARRRANFKQDLQKTVDMFNRDVSLPVESGNDPVKWFTEDAILKDFVDRGRMIHHLDWNELTVQKLLNECCLVHSSELKVVLPVLRKVICKGVPGPGVLPTMAILGRNESLYRVSNYLLK
jgi:glutamyl-tRNA synthetase